MGDFVFVTSAILRLICNWWRKPDYPANPRSSPKSLATFSHRPAVWIMERADYLLLQGLPQ